MISMRRLPLAIAWVLCPLVAGPLSAGTDGWGEPGQGLQMRAIAVSPTADEQQPDFAAARPVDAFTRPDEITLLIELKNVGDQPIVLRGVRYDESMKSVAGRSNSDSFAPLLFRCEFLDANGQPVVGPTNELHTADSWINLSSSAEEHLPPGESLAILLRPARWDASLTRLLAAGRFTIRVHYCGPPREVLEFERARGLQTRFPAETWMGDVASDTVEFVIEREGVSTFIGPKWGPPNNGLRAAIDLRNPAATGRAIVETASSTFSLGSRVEVQFLIENVSDHEITFWSEVFRTDAGTVLDADGKKIGGVGGNWTSGWAFVRHWSLKPGEIAVVRARDFTPLSDEQRAHEVTRRGVSPFVAGPGEYGLRYQLRFNAWRRGQPGTAEAIPRANDWQGTLSTDVTPFHVRP